MVAVILTLIVSLVRMKELIGSREELRKECQGLSSHLDKLNSPVVFCHNDLTCQNMIYCEEEGRIYIYSGGRYYSLYITLVYSTLVLLQTQKYYDIVICGVFVSLCVHMCLSYQCKAYTNVTF